MWIKSWEFVSVIAAALWCLGLSWVGVEQFTVATSQPAVVPQVSVVSWKQPGSGSPTEDHEDYLARQVELKISPPFDVETTVKVQTELNGKAKVLTAKVPMGVQYFKVGFDHGVRDNLYIDEVVQCTIQAGPGQRVGASALHLAQFPGVPNKATLISSDSYLQGGERDSLEVSLELKGRVKEDFEFPLTLEPEKGLVALDSKSLWVRKGQRVSDPVSVKVVNKKVNDQVTISVAKANDGGIELEKDSVTIELLPRPKPVVVVEFMESVLDEGASTKLGFSLAMPHDEDLPVSIQVPLEYQTDVELSETAVVIPAGSKSVSVQVSAVADNVIREPDEDVSFKLVSTADLELPEKVDLTVKDPGDLKVVLTADSTAVLSEEPAGEKIEIELSLADDGVAGAEIVLPCKVVPDGATVAMGDAESGDDVLISGVAPKRNGQRTFDAANSIGEVTISKGKKSASLRLLAVDDRTFMEKESFTIEFDLNDSGKFVNAEGEEVPSKLSFEIEDNDTTLLAPLTMLGLKEGEPLKGDRLGIADVQCDIEKAVTFKFEVLPDSTAVPVTEGIEGGDYRFPQGMEVTLEPGDKVLYLPIKVVDDDKAEPMKELRLAFDDKEIGMLKIALSDDDDPNALEDVGKDVVFLIANDGLVADWDRIKTECLGLLNKPERFEPISNSFFAVHDAKAGSVWDRLDVKRLADYDVAKSAFPPGTTFSSQMKAVVTAWEEIVSRLNGRIPQRVMIVWVNKQGTPDMEPLRATPFKLNGLGKEQVLKLVWYGGNDGSANPIRFLPLQGTGLYGRVIYRTLKSSLEQDLE